MPNRFEKLLLDLDYEESRKRKENHHPPPFHRQGCCFERVDHYVWADVPAILNEICAVAGRLKKTSGKTGDSLETSREGESRQKKYFRDF